MTRQRRVRVQCPNCGLIKDSRGKESFNCKNCSMRWKIEPNKFVQDGGKNSGHKQDYRKNNRRNKPSRDMGKTGQQDTNNRENRKPSKDKMEDKNKFERGTLEL